MCKQLMYIFSKKDKYKIALLSIIMIVGSFMELLGVAIFQPFVDIITDSSAIQESKSMQWLQDFFPDVTLEGFLTILSVIIILIYVVKNIYLWLMQNYILKFTYNVQQKLSVRLLTAYLEEPYTFHLKHNIAELQRSMQEDTSLFSQLLIHVLQLISEIVVCIALGLYLFNVSQSITVITVLLLGICVIGFTRINRNFAKKLGKEAQIYKGKLYQWVNQSLGGVKEVKVLNREEYFISSYKKYFELYIKSVRINRLLSITPKYMVEALCMMGLLLAIIVKLNFGRSGLENFIPQLAVFAVAAFRLLPAVGRINEHVINILYAIPSVDLIYRDLKGIEEYTAQNYEEENKEWKFNEEVIVKKVTYSYPDSDKNVLESASCTIPKGKIVAFVGSSGAGKTTIADIILGLLKPQRGHIRVDDMDIYKNLTIWHHKIGYIPQVIYLSDDTIRNNIAFGIRKNEIDEKAVWEAVNKAQLTEFIEELPEGLDTIVGDRGVRLSGGQRQRIGIARALYHNPEILILDEATSALDKDTENAVMEAIDQLRGTKTMIIIAHRLSTIENADLFYEVENGKIIERSKSYIFPEKNI